MKYHQPSKSFTVTVSDIESVADSLKYAMKQIREKAGLPLTKYQNNTVLDGAEHAQIALMDIADVLDIDLGAKRHYWLDLTDV